MNPEHYRKLERMYHAAPINAYFRPRLTITGEGTAEVEIPIRPEFFHAANAAHGSVYFKAMDDAAFFAVNSLVPEVFVLTVSFTVYFTRPVSDGVIKAAGRVVHESRQLFLAEADVHDSAGKQIGRGSGSFMRSQIALTPEIGYV